MCGLNGKQGRRAQRVEPQVLVIGSGPAGLAISARLQGMKIPFELIDGHGLPGGAYRRMCPNITLSSPASFLNLPGLPFKATRPNVSAGEFADYLVAYARHYELNPVKSSVTAVKARSGSFLVDFDGRPAQSYRAVVAASGMCEHPNLPQIPGLVCPGDATAFTPKAVHAQNWRGDEGPQGRILIVGRGMRAVEIAEECAEQGIPTVISARQRKVRTWRRTFMGVDFRRFTFPATQMLSALLRRIVPSYCSRPFTFAGIDRGFETFRSAGLIDVQGCVTRFEGRTAVFEDGARRDFDLVVTATGYRHLMPFLPAEVARTPAGHVLTNNGQSVSWPGLFVLGTPCASGWASQFIHGIKADTRLVARNILQRLSTTAKPRPAPSCPAPSFLTGSSLTGSSLLRPSGATAGA